MSRIDRSRDRQGGRRGGLKMHYRVRLGGQYRTERKETPEKTLWSADRGFGVVFATSASLLESALYSAALGVPL